jgi:hypothetical protein
LVAALFKLLRKRLDLAGIFSARGAVGDRCHALVIGDEGMGKAVGIAAASRS